ncbi:hypothetical protein C1645_876161 [Glomus cerebriforme]|uniref:Uncharacterized protein n=1 Tax=Glomus cerebriforme TaxID=658196 RepID=A0A397T5I5_9GLOM|nr:hypothetical protein C1645_876161 [Glomus cerebriforme]
MVNAQQWLNEKFPAREDKEKVKKLEIRLNGPESNQINDQTYSFRGVTLEVIDCTNLSELNLNTNEKITSLTIHGCINLLKINGLEQLLNLQDLDLWHQQNSRLQTIFSQSNWKQEHQELRKILLEEKAKNEQHLKELADIVIPNITFDLSKLKQEIARLKLNELTPQAQKEKSDLEQQITNSKNKVENSFKDIIDLLLETQVQIIGKNEPLVQAQLTGKLSAYLGILERNLSEQELQVLLDKKTEVLKLEEQIAKLQQITSLIQQTEL